MDLWRPEPSQLGNPTPNVRPIRIELAPLGDRIEDPKMRCSFGAGSGDPLPVAGVLSDISVDEMVTEETLTLPPVDEEVLHQEAGAGHASAVVHPAGLRQLAHPGVDDRVTGLAGAPSVEAAGIMAPDDLVIPR